MCELGCSPRELYPDGVGQKGAVCAVYPVEREAVFIAEALGNIEGDFALAAFILRPAIRLAADVFAQFGCADAERLSRLGEPISKAFQALGHTDCEPQGRATIHCHFVNY